MPFYKTYRFWISVVGAFITVGMEGLGWDLPSEAIKILAGFIIALLLGEAHIEAKREEVKAAQANLAAAQVYASLRK